METRIEKIMSTRMQLQEISLDITWSKISKKYFGKSSSWIYNKINEIDGNGGKGGFTQEEKAKLKCALNDLAERIKCTAENFK